MANLKKLFYNHREILLYIFFGGFTTVVSIGLFVLFDNVLHIHELIANALSWIFAVGVAYGTNRRWVFCSKATGKAMWTEACAFYGGRLFTLGIEEGALLVFVTWLGMNSTVIKLAIQFVVLTGNYILSKFLIFRNK
jgi:putative flippase GtrA